MLFRHVHFKITQAFVQVFFVGHMTQITKSCNGAWFQKRTAKRGDRSRADLVRGKADNGETKGSVDTVETILCGEERLQGKGLDGKEGGNYVCMIVTRL
jgi:hypothetical protein